MTRSPRSTASRPGGTTPSRHEFSAGKCGGLPAGTARRMTVMTGPWRVDKLSAVAGEPGQRLEWYAEVGLLHRRPDGDFEPDSLHRLRLIRFARSRGVDDEQLAAA